jgi:hypothetical protein
MRGAMLPLPHICPWRDANLGAGTTLPYAIKTDIFVTGRIRPSPEPVSRTSSPDPKVYGQPGLTIQFARIKGTSSPFLKTSAIICYCDACVGLQWDVSQGYTGTLTLFVFNEAPHHNDMGKNAEVGEWLASRYDCFYF